MDEKNSTNRRRSFKRRRLEGGVLTFSGICAVLLMLQNVATAYSVPMDSGLMRIHRQLATGPLHLWHHRVTRDAANVAGMLSSLQMMQHDNARDAPTQLGSSTEMLLDQQLQGQCLLDGEYVPETKVICEKQVGCRAIQKTGHCCPDYKCDCQKDGKTYLNGDKLVDPETPCTVCYCQGGEILCSSVTCFHRDDCTPKYIPGVCCPEYDNCPVVSPESYLNKTASTTTTTTKPNMPPASDNKPKITIKEITKPTEIRITDDNKAIPIHQMLKPSTTTTTTTTSTTTTSTTTTTTPTTILALESTTASSSNTPTSAPSLTNVTSISSNNQATPTQAEGAIKWINSHDTHYGNSLDAFSTGHNPERSDNKVGINSGEILKLTASVAYPPSPPADGMNVAHIATTSSPPLVDTSLEVDDPVPALTAFSTQGLPEDPSKVNIKREYFITTEGVQTVPQTYDGSGEYPTSELIYSGSPTVAVQQQTLNGFQQSSVELDSDTAGSDNIYHIILTTDGPRLSTTSENYLALKGSASTEGSPFEDLSPVAVASSSTLDKDVNNSLASSTEGPEPLSSTITTPFNGEMYAKSSTELISHQHMDEEDSEIPIESNPAYPSLPGEDFSIRGDNNFQLSDNDEMIGEEPRSIGGSGSRSSYDSFKATKHLEDSSYAGESGSGGADIGSGGGAGGVGGMVSGSGSGILVEELMVISSSTTEGSGGMDMGAKTANYEMKSKAPEFMQFLYSAEDSSEETKITNSSDFQIDNETKTQGSSLESTEFNKPLDSLMTLELGSGYGSGAGEIKPRKEREPTTARPYKGSQSYDIDEIHAEASGSEPQIDPKDDAESLKFDDNAADAGFNAETSNKGNVLSVQVKTAQQEKAFQDALV